MFAQRFHIPRCQLLLAALWCAVLTGTAAGHSSATWVGATSTDWATTTNWSVPPTQQPPGQTADLAYNLTFGTPANQNTNNTLTGMIGLSITFNNDNFSLNGNNVI